MREETTLLKVQGLSKAFPGVQALDQVNLTVKEGEVHALVGENGAGKSTLMKCLIGMEKPTTGKIWFAGKELANYQIADALKLGIAMIHQELSPVREKSVMENIWLGREPKNKLGLIDHQQMAQMTTELLQRIDLTIDPRKLMKNLTLANMQMIEIAKALSYDTKLIIMDEPTSSLTSKEISQLFKLIDQLKADKRSVIYISHKLGEIRTICDQLTVLRDGKFIAQKPVSETTERELIQLMVGREIKQLFPKVAAEIGEVKLAVKDFSNGRDFHDISFDLRAGEILGFAGLVGSGRSEVMEALFGVRKLTSGQVELNGQEVKIKSSAEAVAKGLAFLTEDRRKTGIFPMLPVSYNIVASAIGDFSNSLGLISNHVLKTQAAAYVKQLKIKTPSTAVAIRNLSGGNQQKVLIAKWLLTTPEILILDEPTRGIDVGAKSEIHRHISKMAEGGKSIIMVSSELPEILGMSDRVVVMREGRIRAILDNVDLSQETIMAYASGTLTDSPMATTEKRDVRNEKILN